MKLKFILAQPSTREFTYMERLREKNKRQQSVGDLDQCNESSDETSNSIHFELLIMLKSSFIFDSYLITLACVCYLSCISYSEAQRD